MTILSYSHRRDLRKKLACLQIRLHLKKQKTNPEPKNPLIPLSRKRRSINCSDEQLRPSTDLTKLLR